MKNHLFFFLLLATIMVTACMAPPPTLTDSQKAAIEKQILEQWGKVSVAVEKADAEGYTAYLSSKEFLSMSSEGKTFQSSEEYADSVKVWFSARKSVEIQQVTTKVNVLTENLVLLDQKSVFQLNLKDNRIMRFSHAVTFIFKREDAGWKIIHGHESWISL